MDREGFLVFREPECGIVAFVLAVVLVRDWERLVFSLLSSLLLAGCGESDDGTQVEEPRKSDSELVVPAEVTREVFLEWRDARRGTTSGEELGNPYWIWLIEVGDEVSSFAVNDHFGGPSSFGGNPAWAWQRFGRSETRLSDGRTVWVAGEHEDHYDPDFFIYNDVVVRAPDGELTILAYPIEEFPPTDNHSATLVGGEIALVGSLGYLDERREGETQLLVLDLASWRVRRQKTSGQGPGWISSHEAELTENGKSLIVRRGNVWEGPERGLLENIDDWQLDLQDWRWTRLTKREWPLFEVVRVDGEYLQLWDMRQAIWHEKYGKLDFSSFVEDLDPAIQAEMKESLDFPMPKDAEALETLYEPAGVPHRKIPEDEEEDEIGVSRIEVAGVIVRYVEDHEAVLMTVEGELPYATLKALVDDLERKLDRAAGVEHEVRQLRP